MRTISVRLIVQGGGAKIFALVAAFERIEAAEAAGAIKVTHIAGTSAGAIIGGLYAAGVAPSKMFQALRAVDPESLVPSRRKEIARLVWHLLRNTSLKRPLAQISVLESVLRRLLTEAGIAAPDAVFHSVPKRHLVVCATDLSQRRSTIHDSLKPNAPEANRPFVQCLLDSAGLPFFFSVGHIVDGGICSNLPADVLSIYPAESGEAAVAISFQTPAGNVPQGARELAGELLSVSIDESTRRAREYGDMHILELPTYGVGTFDFGKARSFLDRNCVEYQDVQKITDRFFAKLPLEVRRRRYEEKWRGTESPSALRLLKEFRKEAKKRESRFRVPLSRFIVTLDRDGQDEVERYWEFSPAGDDPCVDAISVVLVSPADRFGATDYDAEVKDKVSGDLVRAEIVPVRVETDGKVRHNLLVYLSEPLVDPSRTWVFRCSYGLANVLPALREPQGDEVAVRTLSSSFVTGRAEVGIRYRAGRHLKFTPYADNGEYVQARLLENPETALGLGQLEGYETKGWFAENVPQRKYLGVNVREAS